MPDVLVWNENTNEYQLNTIRNYLPIYAQEEQIVRAHLNPLRTNVNFLYGGI